MALKAWHLVVLATALAFGLALYQLGHESFWLDEILTWRGAHLPFAEIWPQATREYHPPLYLWFMHGWLKLVPAPDEFWLRLPSALFFAFTVPVVYLVGRSLGGTPRAGVYAAFLAATFPFLLHYGQEVRPYAMLTFFAACGFAATAHLVCRCREEARPRLLGVGLAEAGQLLGRGRLRESWRALEDDGAWTVYIASSVAVMGLHNTAGLFTVVTGLILLYAIVAGPSFRGIRFASLCTAMALIAILYSPQVPHLLSGVERVALARSSTPNLSTIVDLFRRVYGNGHFPGWSWIPFVVFASLAMGTLVIWARRGEWRRVAFVGIGWLAAPMLLIAFSFWKPILLPKLVIWTLVPFLAACGAALALLPSLPGRVVLLAALLFSNLQGVVAEWKHVSRDWRSVARIIARDASPDVAVVIALPVNFYVFDYYWSREKRGDIPSYVARAIGAQWVRKVPDDGMDRTGGGRWAPFPSPWNISEWLEVDPAGLFSTHRRIWVVWGGTREGRTGYLVNALEEKGRLVERRSLPGLHLLRYERRK